MYSTSTVVDIGFCTPRRRELLSESCWRACVVCWVVSGERHASASKKRMFDCILTRSHETLTILPFLCRSGWLLHAGCPILLGFATALDNAA